LYTKIFRFILLIITFSISIVISVICYVDIFNMFTNINKFEFVILIPIVLVLYFILIGLMVSNFMSSIKCCKSSILGIRIVSIIFLFFNIVLIVFNILNLFKFFKIIN